MIFLKCKRPTRDNFNKVANHISEEVNKGNVSKVSKEINDLFFGGGVLDDKKFSDIATLKYPVVESTTLTYNCVPCVLMGAKKSISAIMGFVEGIPVIGSPIAVMNATYHLFGMLSSYSTLKKTAKDISTTTEPSVEKTKKIFESAVDYTMHQNHLVGSLLSIIPLLKPICRLAQAAIHSQKVHVEVKPMYMRDYNPYRT